jgi:hypothetical protein
VGINVVFERVANGVGILGRESGVPDVPMTAKPEPPPEP